MTWLKTLHKPRCHRCLADTVTFCNKVTAGPKARRKSVNELLIDSVDKFELKIHVEDPESYMSTVDGLSTKYTGCSEPVVPIHMKNLNDLPRSALGHNQFCGCMDCTLSRRLLMSVNAAFNTVDARPKC